MLKQLWTFTAGCLVTATLAGCTGPGRFDRGQYASLATDPFLATDDVAGSSDGSAAGVMTASASANQAGVPASVGKSGASCETGCEMDSATQKTAKDDTIDFGASIAAAGDAVASQAANNVADAGSGFGSWLQEKGNNVVQASAEFGSRARPPSGGLQQADFSVFPAPEDNDPSSPSMSADFKPEDNPFADGPPAADNPFADNPFTQQGFAASEEEPLFQTPAESQESWPPANFQFD